MNKEQRKRLEVIESAIEDAIADLEAIRDEEQDKVDNAPDNLNTSPLFEKMEEYIDALQEVIDELDNTLGELRENVTDNY